MLTAYDLAFLDGACVLARQLKPGAWQAGRMLCSDERGEGGLLIILLAEDYRCVKVVLYGPERQRFEDWLAACQERCAPRDRPRSNRAAERLGDRIIFKVA